LNILESYQNINIIYEAVDYNVLLSIYDVSGREVYSSNFEGGGLKSYSLPSYVLEKGLYIVSLKINNNILTDRLVIN